MPPVTPPLSGFLMQRIGALETAFRGLQTQQQMTLSNQQGAPVLNFGVSPGSNPAQYGLQFVDPNSGEQIMFVGEDGSGNAAMSFFNSSGGLVLQIDASGLHVYDGSGGLLVSLTTSGLTAGGVSLTSAGLAAGGGVEVNSNGLEVYNGSTLEVLAGLLSASPVIYGLGVLPHGGSQLQQVGGAISGAVTSASNVTNTAWAYFTSGAVSAAEIGPSGEALISLNGRISTGTATEQGTLGVGVDSAAPSGYPVATLSSNAGAVSGTVSIQFVWSGLSAGVHSFSPWYETANNGSSTCSFSEVVLTVQPL